ncbi:MAG TPA: chromosomal replication initiator protein DnaA [Longimicrobium sp.]
MELSAGEVWSRILDGAKQALPEQAFRTWLQPTQAVAISQDLLVVSTPNPFAVDWVEDKYAELLTGIGEHLFGRRFQLSVQFNGAGRPASVPPPAAPVAAAPVAAPPARAAAPEAQGPGARPSAPLNPRYTFDRFVVGSNNQLSAAAAHAVAEAPARTYNPLFIYGGVGLGKTHLMHAIGYAMLERDPSKKIMYLSSERFTNELVSAIQEGSMAEFRRQYRQIDLLLVDDIQFLEGKERTQEEFFHTFNALYEAQRQIVLTSDRPPKEIGLEDRLISRFEWGLVTDIKAPDFETRMAILRKKVEEDQLSPKLTFDQFVIGDSNRFAHAAALAVAELPGQAYNPLFIYGPPGVGKTHLLHSIGNYVQAYGAGATVRCTTAEAFTNAFLGALHGGGLRVRSTTAERFTNEFVAALQARNVEEFKARFRATDVLLIDDVQFLQRKVKTEEEFFHTFNALHETGSQLVLTCDRLPADMAALEARLLERFQAGLVAEIKPPDLATRLTILRKRVQHDGIELADEGALHAIAHRITANARALEGALIRVVAYHSLTGRPIDVELADEVLAGLYPNARPQPRPLTVERVQELTCDAFSISREELLSSARSGRVAWPRQIAMYLARQHTGETLPAIGRQFGGRNHTTVMYACRKAAERIAEDPAAQAVVCDLERRLVDSD